jgi:Ni,Fe-hydrogenase I small subunit
MYYPTSHPWTDGQSLGEHLEERGVSRRQFLEFCGSMCAVLGLSESMLARVAQQLATVKRPSVIWLQLQECTGCVESALRTAEPTILT